MVNTMNSFDTIVQQLANNAFSTQQIEDILVSKYPEEKNAILDSLAAINPENYNRTIVRDGKCANTVDSILKDKFIDAIKQGYKKQRDKKAQAKKPRAESKLALARAIFEEYVNTNTKVSNQVVIDAFVSRIDGMNPGLAAAYFYSIKRDSKV
jgi:hypothetical protein